MSPTGPAGPDSPPAGAGEEVTGEDAEQLQLALALALAFAYLTRRERTVGEVERHLEGKGIGAQTRADTVCALRDDGYLSDERFALMFVHDKRTLESWGSERIRRALAARGIERELIEDALARDEVERGGGEREIDRALSILRRRFPSPPRERRDRDRALGMLVRKGFDTELALDALNAHAHAA